MGQINLGPPPQPIPIARRPFNPRLAAHSLRALDVECPFCHALHWVDEHLSGSSKIRPKFGMCCYQGKIALPPLQEPPRELMQLYNRRVPQSANFHKNIRRYNNALAFTSMGRQIDRSINAGGGPYVFKMHGELIHRIGSLLPADNARPQPVYAQLYIYDPQAALNMCMGHDWNSGLSRDIMGTLQDVLHCHHPGAALYKHAQKLVANIPEGDNCQLLIHFDAACDKRCYNASDAASKEISIMIPEESYDKKGSQDIIVNLRDGPLEHISDCHPFYPALRYVLLFPKGQVGWQPNIPYDETENANETETEENKKESE